MPKTEIVYLLVTSTEEERPYIDFEMSDERQSLDWSILEDRAPKVDNPTEMLRLYQPESDLWDFYLAAPYGMVSERARKVLEPFATGHFEFVEGRLCDTPYYFLLRTTPLNCFDRANAKVVPFASDPSGIRIMKVNRFAFFKERIQDPLLFWTEETGAQLLATQSIKTLVETTGLRGFRFLDTDRFNSHLQPVKQ